MLSIKIEYIHQCENTDHVYAIVRTSPQATTWSLRATWCPQHQVGDPWFKVSSKCFDCHTLLCHNNALSKILERKVLDKFFTSLIKC